MIGIFSETVNQYAARSIRKRRNIFGGFNILRRNFSLPVECDCLFEAAVCRSLNNVIFTSWYPHPYSPNQLRRNLVLGDSLCASVTSTLPHLPWLSSLRH